jgi:hypothetical protein
LAGWVSHPLEIADFHGILVDGDYDCARTKDGILLSVEYEHGGKVWLLLPVHTKVFFASYVTVLDRFKRYWGKL